MDNRLRYYQILPDKIPDKPVVYTFPTKQARMQIIPTSKKAQWVQRPGNAQPDVEAKILGRINEIRMGRASQTGDPAGR